jgi:hypothetical protein
MKSAIESFLSAEQNIFGALVFKIKEQASRNCDFVISGD